jgi:hypothetical protein
MTCLKDSQLDCVLSLSFSCQDVSLVKAHMSITLCLRIGPDKKACNHVNKP